MRLRIIFILIIAQLFICCNNNDLKKSDLNSYLILPSKSSINIASIDDAFALILNSKDRSERYTATLYLKSHLGEETIKHYGNLLFKISSLKARIKVYESMGYFGGYANAAILSEYLMREEEIYTKVQIICSLGLIGKDAAQFLPLIKNIRDSYSDIYKSRESKDGSILVNTGEISWIIREDSMEPEQFLEIVNKSIKKIQ
jgi:hypothetical protein